MIKCDKCGAENWAGAKFCSQCGNPFEAGEQAPDKRVVPPNPPKPSSGHKGSEWYVSGGVVLLIIVILKALGIL